MTTIELLKPHTHAGRDYAPGDRFDLDEGAAHWLIGIGVAKAAHAADATHTTDATRDPQRKTKE